MVGASNQLAYAAALAVASRPGEAYNPLFLYAGVGLGKTHLLHAIGHACASKGMSYLYVSSEQFTNDFVTSIQTRRTREFREKYHGVEPAADGRHPVHCAAARRPRRGFSTLSTISTTPTGR